VISTRRRPGWWDWIVTGCGTFLLFVNISLLSYVAVWGVHVISTGAAAVVAAFLLGRLHYLSCARAVPEKMPVSLELVRADGGWLALVQTLGGDLTSVRLEGMDDYDPDTDGCQAALVYVVGELQK
jgi:hypothetical protein